LPEKNGKKSGAEKDDDYFALDALRRQEESGKSTGNK